MAHIPTGTVVKILHQGQKAYAVVKEDKTKAVVLVFPFASNMEEIELLKTQCRMPSAHQACDLFVLLRQLVGIPLEESHSKPKVVAAAGKLTPKDKPTDAALDKAFKFLIPGVVPAESLPKPFTITHPELNNGQPTPVEQVEDPTGMLNAIKKNLQGIMPEVTGIEWADEKPDTKPKE